LHNKDVLKPFNVIGRKGEHFNKYVPLMKVNPTSTTKRKKTFDQKNDEFFLLNIKKILKTLLNIHDAIVVKHCFLLHLIF
jgi:hypothetical protein